MNRIPIITVTSGIALIAATMSSSCFMSKGGGGGVSAEEALNEWLRNQYPDGHAASDIGRGLPRANEPQDPGYNVLPSSLNVSVSTSDGPVDSVCVGFGSVQDAWCVPATNPDVTVVDTDGDGVADSASLDMDMPPNLCDGLSEICHDIRCYEFAQTEFGTFTAADVGLLAARCGQCDEPSCQSLIGDECESGDTGWEGGSVEAAAQNFCEQYCETSAECGGDTHWDDVSACVSNCVTISTGYPDCLRQTIDCISGYGGYTCESTLVCGSIECTS